MDNSYCIDPYVLMHFSGIKICYKSKFLKKQNNRPEESSTKWALVKIFYTHNPNFGERSRALALLNSPLAHMFMYMYLKNVSNNINMYMYTSLC